LNLISKNDNTEEKHEMLQKTSSSLHYIPRNRCNITDPDP
jgi:hypothetical protein